MLSPYDDVDVGVRYVRLMAHLKLNEFDQVFRLLRLTISGVPGTKATQALPKIPDQLVSCHQRL